MTRGWFDTHEAGRVYAQAGVRGQRGGEEFSLVERTFGLAGFVQRHGQDGLALAEHGVLVKYRAQPLTQTRRERGLPFQPKYAFKQWAFISATRAGQRENKIAALAARAFGGNRERDVTQRRAALCTQRACLPGCLRFGPTRGTGDAIMPTFDGPPAHTAIRWIHQRQRGITHPRGQAELRRIV